MEFALLYFYDFAQAGPAEGGVSGWPALDAEIEEAGARRYGAGLHPESSSRTVREGQARIEGGVAGSRR